MKRMPLILMIVVLAAAVPRIIGVWYGFPNLYHPDEEIFIGHAIRFGTGDLNPHWYNYPHFYMYLIFASDIVYFLCMKIAGVFQDTAAFKLEYILHPWKFYLIGRILSVLAGIMGAVSLYFAGREAGGRWAGAAAGLGLAAYASHMYHSRMAVADATMCFFVCVSFALLCAFVARKQWRWFYLAVIASALGVATKYNAGFMIFALIPALLFTPGAGGAQVRARAAVISACLGIAFLFLGSPYLFLDFKSFYAGFGKEYSYIGTGWLGTEGVKNGWLYHLGTLWRNFKPPLFLLAFGGLFWWVFIRRNVLAAVLAACFAVTFLYLGTRKIFSPHYLFPILPILCISAGVALAAIRTRLKQAGLPQKRADLFCAALLAVFVLPPWVSGFREAIIFCREDTRTEARNWIDENIPEGSFIALEAWGPWLGIERAEIETKYKIALDTDPAKAEFYRLRLEKGEFSPFRLYGLNSSSSDNLMERVKDSTRYDFDALRDMGIEYVIINESMFLRYKRFPDLYPVQNRFYKILDEQAHKIKEFPSVPTRPGPGLIVYRMPRA